MIPRDIRLSWLDALIIVSRNRTEFLGWLKTIWPCLTPAGQRQCSDEMLARELAEFQPRKP